ncbi:hypothetical protein Acsp01_89690 [Actinoplanes sp. NBRC 101535]|nr:hypothetical protein Acsp01_89690 [Actinoplanes sp. NBRC 101535]
MAERIRIHRRQRRSRWRRLNAGDQALLALAHLRNGDTYTRLAAGFGIGVATAWRYVREAVDLLATAADNLITAMNRIRALAFAILDGTDRDRPGRRPAALLLRKAQAARREYAGHKPTRPVG